MHVWVVVASKYGSTREVAEAIAGELSSTGEVEVRDAPGVDGFGGTDAVVLGSVIYARRWLGAARTLVDEHAHALASRPTWLFSCGPVGDPQSPRMPAPTASRR